MTKICEQIENPADIHKAIMAIQDEGKRNIEIAYWSMLYLRDYKKKPWPTKPDEWLDFERRDKKERDKIRRNPDDYKGFWFDRYVMEYVEGCGRIDAVNWNHLQHLKWMKEVLKGDAAAVISIESVIYSYQDADHEEPEVKKAVEMFKGRVVDERQDRFDR